MKKRAALRHALSACGLISIVLVSLIDMALAQERPKLVFAMTWAPSDHHAPYFVAIEKGYYAKQGLDVEVQFSKGSNDAIAKLDSGRVDFAAADAASALAAMARGAQIKIVGIVFHSNPLNFFLWKDSPIKTPKDIEGKTIGGAVGDSHRAMFPAFAKKYGVDPSKVEWVNITPSAKISALTAKRVDVVGDYSTVLPLYENGMGEGNVRTMPWGLDLYGVSIVTRNDTFAKNPDMIKKFLEASYQGWRDTIKDPDEALRIFKKHVPELEMNLIRRKLDMSIKMVVGDYALQHGLGVIDQGRMCSTVALANELMDIPRKLDCNEVYSGALVPSVKIDQ